MFHVELAPWGVFLPSEVRFRGILALSRAWFYNGQKQKCKFLKKGSLPDFQILCGDLWGNFTKNGTYLRPGQFFYKIFLKELPYWLQVFFFSALKVVQTKKTSTLWKVQEIIMYLLQVEVRVLGKSFPHPHLQNKPDARAQKQVIISGFGKTRPLLLPPTASYRRRGEGRNFW